MTEADVCANCSHQIKNQLVGKYLGIDEGVQHEICMYPV